MVAQFSVWRICIYFENVIAQRVDFFYLKILKNIKHFKLKLKKYMKLKILQLRRVKHGNQQSSFIFSFILNLQCNI